MLFPLFHLARLKRKRAQNAVSYLEIAISNLGASASPNINSATDAASYVSPSVTPLTTGVHFVFVQSSGTGGPHVPTVAGWGLTWVQIGATLNAGSARGLSLFAALAAGAAAGAVTVTFPATQLACMAAFVHSENVDVSGGLAAAFAQQVANGSTSNATNPSLAMAAPLNAANRPLAAFFHVVQEAMNARANWTKGDELTGASYARAMITEWRNDAFEATASASWATGSGWGGMVVELKAAIAEDALASLPSITVGGEAMRTSNLELTATLANNSLNFASAYRTAALAALDGATARLASFIGGFGENDPLVDWDGVGAVPAIGAMFTAGIDRYAAIATALGVPLDWIVWRLPWQFTEHPVTGVNSVAGDYYGTENRRLRADRVTDFTTYLRRIAGYLIGTHGARRFKIGSEMKGFQTDTVNGLSQTWDYGPYFDFYEICEDAIMLGADDAVVARANILIAAPYPVVAHQGASDADSVSFDARNTVTAPVESIRYKDDAADPQWSMNNPGWGFPNKAPLQAIVEFFKQAANAGRAPSMSSTDFGMFNNDNIIYSGDDFYVAEQRTRDHLRWMKRALTDIADGEFAALVDWMDIAEVYWKAQGTIAPGNTLEGTGDEPPGPYLPEAQRAPYMAALKAIGLAVCVEEGARSPSLWTFDGSGDGRTSPRLTGGQNNDEQRLYAAAVVPEGDVGEGTLTVVGQVYKWFAAEFEAGTVIYPVTVSDPSIYALASATKVLVVNKTGNARSVLVEGDEVELDAYETVLVNR